MLSQAVEILAALRQLGETLSPQEEAFLQEHKTNELAGFEQASADLGKFSHSLLVIIKF
jgi:hypothetical protein